MAAPTPSKKKYALMLISHGSPSPEQTRLQLKEFTKQLNLLSSPLEKLEKNIHDARESCRNYEL